MRDATIGLIITVEFSEAWVRVGSVKHVDMRKRLGRTVNVVDSGSGMG
jgi:hypothetical protein